MSEMGEHPCAICGDPTLGLVTINMSSVAVCDSDRCSFLKEYEDDDSIGGRWLEAVCEYASTCDGCQELSTHDDMVMDANTQLGYCSECVEKGNIPDNFEEYTEEPPMTDTQQQIEQFVERWKGCLDSDPFPSHSEDFEKELHGLLRQAVDKCCNIIANDPSFQIRTKAGLLNHIRRDFAWLEGE